MLRVPSSRKRNKVNEKPSLVPVMDAVFILIFFLLLSFSFIKVYEIASDVPLVSSSPEPKSKKKPLALTLRIYDQRLELLTGVPGRVVKRFSTNQKGEYPLIELHDYLVGTIKKRHADERSIILEPRFNLEYGKIVEIMDAVRQLLVTDEAFFETKGTGEGAYEERHFNLFDKIVFGNIQEIVQGQ